MANGFLTSSPGSRHGDQVSDIVATSVASKFTCPGSGTQEISEIGMWLSADSSTAAAFRLAIYTHDAVNNNPNTMVANSESAELTHNTTSVVKKSHTYGTKPQLTGGTVYWLARNHADSNSNQDRLSGGGAVFVDSDVGGYPTWATAAQWDAGSEWDDDVGIYAVYQAAGGSGNPWYYYAQQQ